MVNHQDMIISWTCDNEPANIKSSRIHVTESGKLRIKSAKVGDSCNYRCEAADGFGTLSVIIKVIIVDKRLMDQLARQNQTKTVVDYQVGKPSPVKNQLYSGNNNHLASRAGSSYASLSGGPQLGDSNPLNDDGSSGGKLMNNEHHHRPTIVNNQEPELEINVEPSNVLVARNRSFTLECRVKHAPHLKVPQIIWLKEFIGKRPDSLNEAHEENLMLIDNVYYHSLNWPRSISYSRKTACANSALLIRQSNFAHSGKYICFAGYPSSLLSWSANLTFSPEPSALLASDGKPAIPVASRDIKHRMALAVVKVDDDEGERNYKLGLESKQQPESPASSLVDDGVLRSQAPHERGSGSETNLFINIISNNTWTRNLTIFLVLCCGLLYGLKFVHYKVSMPKLIANLNFSKHSPAAMKKGDRNKFRDCSLLESVMVSPTTTSPIEAELSVPTKTKSLHLHHAHHHHHHHHHNQQNALGDAVSPKCALATSATDKQISIVNLVHTDEDASVVGNLRRVGDESIVHSMKEPTFIGNDSLFGLGQQHSQLTRVADGVATVDHLYSEIGERQVDRMLDGGGGERITTATIDKNDQDVGEDAESTNYKVPLNRIGPGPSGFLNVD